MLVFRKEFFENVYFEKKVSRRQNVQEKLPSMQRVKDSTLSFGSFIFQVYSAVPLITKQCHLRNIQNLNTICGII